MESIDVKYPFYRGTFLVVGDDWRDEEKPTWIPGVVYEPIPPDTSEAVADGEGLMTLTIVSAHKPGRFPERVFFTRAFTSPDGQTFGNQKLHIATREKFRRLCRGYAHPYRLRAKGGD